MTKLALMPVVEHLDQITPAAMYEVVAAKYLKLGIHDFRKLVDKGAIVFRTHPGRIRRIYLKSDLDEYLSRLPKGKMAASEDSPGPFKKGA
jgi:hypothetical protein